MGFVALAVATLFVCTACLHAGWCFVCTLVDHLPLEESFTAGKAPRYNCSLFVGCKCFGVNHRPRGKACSFHRDHPPTAIASHTWHRDSTRSCTWYGMCVPEYAVMFFFFFFFCEVNILRLCHLLVAIGTQWQIDVYSLRKKFRRHSANAWGDGSPVLVYCPWAGVNAAPIYSRTSKGGLCTPSSNRPGHPEL